MTGREPPADVPAGLTRRRTLLLVGGAVMGAAGYGYGMSAGDSGVLAAGQPGDQSAVSSAHVDAAVAVAEAVYPASVAVTDTFVEQRVFGRIEPRPGHFDGVVEAIEAVDAHARARFGRSIVGLDPGSRRRVLRSMGVPEVHPTPDGTTAERVRFYLVNDLLYALFTSPLSQELTGIENPPGHPGGREAYRRGPDDRSRPAVDGDQRRADSDDIWPVTTDG